MKQVVVLVLLATLLSAQLTPTLTSTADKEAKKQDRQKCKEQYNKDVQGCIEQVKKIQKQAQIHKTTDPAKYKQIAIDARKSVKACRDKALNSATACLKLTEKEAAAAIKRQKEKERAKFLAAANQRKAKEEAQRITKEKSQRIEKEIIKSTQKANQKENVRFLNEQKNTASQNFCQKTFEEQTSACEKTLQKDLMLTRKITEQNTIQSMQMRVIDSFRLCTMTAAFEKQECIKYSFNNCAATVYKQKTICDAQFKFATEEGLVSDTVPDCYRKVLKANSKCKAGKPTGSATLPLPVGPQGEKLKWEQEAAKAKARAQEEKAKLEKFQKDQEVYEAKIKAKVIAELKAAKKEEEQMSKKGASAFELLM